MTAKQAKTAALALMLAFPCAADAQFNTLRKTEPAGYVLLPTKGKEILTSVNQSVDTTAAMVETPDATLPDNYDPATMEDPKRPLRKNILDLRGQTLQVQKTFFPMDQQIAGHCQS